MTNIVSISMSSTTTESISECELPLEGEVGNEDGSPNDEKREAIDAAIVVETIVGTGTVDGNTMDTVDDIVNNETWEITRRDLPITNATAIGALDHAYTVLKERLGSNGVDIDTTKFQKTLPRVLNSEIELGKRIAWGAFAEIYLIKDWSEAKSVKACTLDQLNTATMFMLRHNPQDLVIKVLRPTVLLNSNLYATAAADILTEATLLATLDHPNIVKIWGRSVASVEGFASGKRDAFFVILERLDGTLHDRLSHWKKQMMDKKMIIKQGIREGMLHRLKSLLDRIHVMTQLANAMVYLHRRFIVHRDLKLSNVAMDRNGIVKLIDFGLARILPPHNSDDTFQLTSNTGSIRYMAPEIARGERYNLKADVFSFSILLYEVLNLDKVWNGQTPDDIRTKVALRKQRPLPSMFWPAGLRDLLKSTWSDVPSARLPMIQVHSALETQAKHLQTEIDTAAAALEGKSEEPAT